MLPLVPCAVLDLGRAPFEAVLAEQRALVERRAAGQIVDTLILVEHDAVITLGRKARGAGNVIDAGDTPVVSVERGGDVTWHGPGQLVAYPIFQLAEGERDAPGFIRRLEAWLMAALVPLGVADAERRAGYSGVWARGQKLASIGIAVTARWVTWHGVALNVSTQLERFAAINPCGLQAGIMTSIEALTSTRCELSAARSALLDALPTALGRTPEAAPNR